MVNDGKGKKILKISADLSPTIHIKRACNCHVLL